VIAPRGNAAPETSPIRTEPIATGKPLLPRLCKNALDQFRLIGCVRWLPSRCTIGRAMSETLIHSSSAPSDSESACVDRLEWDHQVRPEPADQRVRQPLGPLLDSLTGLGNRRPSSICASSAPFAIARVMTRNAHPDRPRSLRRHHDHVRRSVRRCSAVPSRGGLRTRPGKPIVIAALPRTIRDPFYETSS